MSKKSHHFLTLWPWPLTYDLEKLIRSGHYHYQCVNQIWEQSIPWFLSYRVKTIAGGGRRAAGGGWRAAGGGRRETGDGRLRRKTITSPDPSDTGDIIINQNWFRQWLGTEKTLSHYLGQWWSRPVVHIWVSRIDWVDYFTVLGKYIHAEKNGTVWAHEGYLHPHSWKWAIPTPQVGLRDGLTMFCKIPIERGEGMTDWCWPQFVLGFTWLTFHHDDTQRRPFP